MVRWFPETETSIQTQTQSWAKAPTNLSQATMTDWALQLIKYAGAQRGLFLVDRNNLDRQALKEFQAFKTTDEQRFFTELYNVQHMQSNRLDTVSKVCITTIQRLYTMLQGEELDPELEERAGLTQQSLRHEPPPVEYNSSQDHGRFRALSASIRAEYTEA